MNRFEELFGKQCGEFVVIPSILEKYSKTHTIGFDLTNKQNAEMVFFPKDAEQISEILSICNVNHIPVVVRGGGSDHVGSNLPISGGAIIDMKKMNKIYIDKPNHWVIAEAGAHLIDISKNCDKINLFFPHELVSQNSATVGGAISMNSYGLRSAEYRSLSSLILGMTFVLPSGKIITISPNFKSSVGYDLSNSLIGSEGTLAVITSATLRLLSAPENRVFKTFLVKTSDSHEETFSKIFFSLKPKYYSLMDLDFLRRVESTSIVLSELSGIDEEKFHDNGGNWSLVTIGFEDYFNESRFSTLLAGLSKSSYFELDSSGIFEGRFSKYFEYFNSLLKIIDVSIKEYDYSSLDVSLPIQQVPIFKEKIRNIATKSNIILLDIESFSSPYTLGVDFLVKKGDTSSYETFSNSALTECLKLNGSVSFAHGVGLRGKSIAMQQLGKDYFELMGRIKTCFDPNGIMNPHKLFD